MPIDFRSCLNALSDVIINRPPPLRHFDQIYMKLPDMLLQAELIGRWFNGKRVFFVGDGGNTCHPISIVQPFANLTVREQGAVLLIMEPINSRAEPDIVPAKEYSRDGVNWESIPDGIRVTGSRYALVLDEIKPGDLEITLAEYEVALGPSAGKAAELYLQGHIDKGCFTKSKQSRAEAAQKQGTRKVGYMAQLKEPFAVLLRG